MEPEWLPGNVYADTIHRQNADFWVSVGEDLAFPVAERGGRNVVLTCLTRGGYSEHRRALRNKVKRDKRAAREARRQFESWRGEKNPRWQ